MNLKCNFQVRNRHHSAAHWCTKACNVSILSRGIPALFMPPHPPLCFPRASCPSLPPRAANFFSLRLTRQRGISADGLLILSGSVHRASRSGRSWRSGAGDGDEMDSPQPNLEGADRARSSEVCARVARVRPVFVRVCGSCF